MHNVLYALQHIKDVFPHGKAGSNSDTCPSASLIHIAHLLDDADLLYKEAGTRAG